MAQLKATSDSDYYAFFCDKIGNVYGIVHTAQKEKKIRSNRCDVLKKNVFIIFPVINILLGK